MRYWLVIVTTVLNPKEDVDGIGTLNICQDESPFERLMIEDERNEKVSNHGSIPITIDSNVVAFIVFEEGFHQPIKRTKQSVFLDVTVFRHTLVD
ncbi:hypothetical protein TNCV_4442051 [Trichonephila clavipes]|nr:hypothetical protein TNCV_4442051 [Trichonephila clavipes]